MLDFEDVLFDGSKENDLNAMTANGNNIDTDSLPIVVRCEVRFETRTTTHRFGVFRVLDENVESAGVFGRREIRSVGIYFSTD